MRALIAKCLGIGIFAGLVCISAAAAEGTDWLNPEFGPFTPNIHVTAAVGSSSGDPEMLAVGHHDPTREDGTVQGIELGASLRTEYLEGFATYNLGYGADEEWSDEWEEAFLKLQELPGGFEIRGGRMLARYGQHNATHLHSWSFVDMPLVLGSFLGEDGLIYDGGDITWLKQDIATVFGLTVAYGEAKVHEHDHGHENGEHDEHEGDENDEHEDGEHGEHEDGEHDGHEGDEHHMHEEAPSFADDVYSGRAFARWRNNDFHGYEAGLSLAIGDDESERDIATYGADFTYTWRENGLEAGGRALTWQTELLYRDIDDGEAEEEHDEHEGEEHDEHEDDEHHEHDKMPGGSEFGFYSQVVYSHDVNWDLAARIGYVAGDEDLHSDDRLRLSTAATYWIYPHHAALRLQYNYDDIENADDEHSIWLQLSLSLGGPEVR